MQKSIVQIVLSDGNYYIVWEVPGFELYIHGSKDKLKEFAATIHNMVVDETQRNRDE